ncbi:MAG: hypothetical protein K9M54_02020 [Kiritimatiellales bacterium]|nr:hypothetical protein [Kiritimatiellales bacterium]
MNNDYLSSSCNSGGGCAACSSGCGPSAFATARPLGEITAILADLGLEVTYAYDDLVFVQHSAFLLQFTDKPKYLKLFTNTECDQKEANDVACNMVLAFHKAGFIAHPSGKYTVSQNEDETLNLAFA